MIRLVTNAKFCHCSVKGVSETRSIVIYNKKDEVREIFSTSVYNWSFLACYEKKKTQKT